MKKILLLAITPALILFLSLKLKNNERKTFNRDSQIISCASATEIDIAPDSAGKFAPVLPGWGNHVYIISTKNDSAQFYFNQGLSLYYGYHSLEAIASFNEAARFDQDCAMAYWGQALAMGPNINRHPYKTPERVLDAIEKMNEAKGKLTEKEKELLTIMNKRYSQDTSAATRVLLNSAYANGFKSLMEKYPNDLDIKALYIDAVMVEHPWDFWKSDGTPKEWTPEIVSLCEQILKADPNHPAALHYYIHAVEASHHPEAALHSADVLKDIMPGVAHMVHMASHMYIRNALYSEGVEVNEKAKENFGKYDSIAPNLNIKESYTGGLMHTFHVQTHCALNGGMYKQSMQLAIRCRQSVSTQSLNGTAPLRNYAQYVYMTPLITLVRLGKWQEILSNPSPDSNWTYACIIDDFAKGLAYVRSGSTIDAKKKLE